MSRKEPKQKRSQELVDSILTAATRVFGSFGFGPASTNQIAEKAGVSVGSLYQYFSDKASIMDKLIERNLIDVESKIEKKITELKDQSPEKIIDILVESAIEMQTRDSSFRRELALRMISSGKIGLMLKHRKSVAKKFETLLHRHQNKLRLKHADFALVSYMVVSTVQGVMAAIQFDPEMTPELKSQLIRETSTLVKSYLL